MIWIYAGLGFLCVWAFVLSIWLACEMNYRADYVRSSSRRIVELVLRDRELTAEVTKVALAFEDHKKSTKTNLKTLRKEASKGLLALQKKTHTLTDVMACFESCGITERVEKVEALLEVPKQRFRVKQDIDVFAHTPEEAAEAARELLGSAQPFDIPYEIRDESGNQWTVDLSGAPDQRVFQIDPLGKEATNGQVSSDSGSLGAPLTAGC